MHNWSQTIRYSSSRLERPRGLAELRELVAGNDRVKALGSRHSFNGSADTDGIHIALDRLPRRVEVEEQGERVTSGAGLTHFELSADLHRHGLALPNLASLPHISVGGAIQTGTHGSGCRNAALSANVVALEIVDSTGDLRHVAAGDHDFPAVVVGLGAFGIVSAVTQRCVPAFYCTQTVHENLPWHRLLPQLEDVMSSAYSVSLFTRYDAPTVPQVWVKHRAGDPDPLDLATLGAVPARRTLHPLPDTAADSVTEQLGSAGPSHERLPHFRHDFKPSRGDEIQSEYLLDVDQGVVAIEAMRTIGARVAPLLHMAEIRRVAPDDSWLSPSGGRDSIALHFTWRRLPDEVAHILPVVEDLLMTLGARPHWGKAFACDHAALRAVYPRLDEFAAAVDRWDPRGKFTNSFLRRVLGRDEEAFDPDGRHD